MSYSSTWTYLLKLTEDAQYAQRVQNGHWMWVYDNLNLHQVVRHEREGILGLKQTNKQKLINANFRQTLFDAERNSSTCCQNFKLSTLEC